MARLTITLRDQEKLALSTLADREFREPRAQAALIIRQELERLGLLQVKQNADQMRNMHQRGQHEST
jgi:hypothetical protein